MNRFETATYLFDKKKYFKLVCGAGNEDAEEVRRYVFVYALAGAKCFDVSANVEVVKAACNALDEAFLYAPKIGRKLELKPFINVSIGMRGDPHIRKARTNEKCVKCGECIGECPVDAINEKIDIDDKKCIGCGNCETVCPYSAISFYHKEQKLKEVLDECKKSGTEQMELHAAVPDSESIFIEWEVLNDIITENYISMCLDRSHLGDYQLIKRIEKAKGITGERIIIQADGVPMSGGSDDYNTTLQAVAIADIIMKNDLDVKVLLSGGTNSLTADLAEKCSVKFDGVAIGTFARNLVKKLIKQEDFMNNDNMIKEAVFLADKLIFSNIGEPLW